MDCFITLITNNPHFSYGLFSSLAGGALRSGTLAFSTFAGWETFTYYQWQVFGYLWFSYTKTQAPMHKYNQENNQISKDSNVFSQGCSQLTSSGLSNLIQLRQVCFLFTISKNRSMCFFFVFLDNDNYQRNPTSSLRSLSWPIAPGPLRSSWSTSGNICHVICHLPQVQPQQFLIGIENSVIDKLLTRSLLKINSLSKFGRNYAIAEF